MKLIIAEKPSLARNIVAAIGQMKRAEGYFYNDEYVVTYAFGHLFGLFDVDDYLPEKKEDKKYWSLDDLPFYPSEFKFKLTSGSKQQFEIIKKLISSNKIDTIVNAGDSDREGEIIVRLILAHAMSENKPVKRLWMPDQTPKTIRKELEEMKDDSAYDNLANEGYARTYVDWLYGINLTRFASIKSGSLLRVGRVIAPIVREIYNKEIEIENFKPRKYYALTSKEKTNGEEIELTSKTDFDVGNEEEMNAFLEKLNSSKAYVTNISTEEKIIPSPRLFSLSVLQGELGKKFKMKPDKALKITQDLYEKGFVSYPRTPSQYLATNEKEKFREIISNLQNMGVNVAFKDSKNIFDDSKIESHSALTPTYKIPKKSDLNEDEQKVYSTICHCFFAVFAKDPYKINRTTMEISLGDIEKFKLTGDVILSKGWTEFEPRDSKDKVLPSLNVGDEVNINFKAVKKETKAPKRFTVASFNNFLKNPFKKEIEDANDEDTENQDDSEDIKAMFDGVELGTEATRSGIIANAQKEEYILLKNNTYYLQEKGRFYIKALDEMKVSLEKVKTAELGRNLKRVYKGEISIDDCVEIAKNEISSMLDKNVVFYKKSKIRDDLKILCECPRCHNPVYITEKGWQCFGRDCYLGFYKNNPLLKKLGVQETDDLVKDIFTKGQIVLKLVNHMNGEEYSQVLRADIDGHFFKFTFLKK